MTRSDRARGLPGPCVPADRRSSGGPRGVLPIGPQGGLDAAELRLVWRALLFDGASVPAWHEDAACEGESALFLAEVDGRRQGDDAVQAAKRICSRCAVRRTCLEDAMAHESTVHRHGVVGGLSASERRHLHREREVAPSWAR